MRKVVILLLFISQWACAQTIDSLSQAPAVCVRIDSLIQVRVDSLLASHAEMLERTQLGLYIYDLTADSAIYKHGWRQQLRPASNEKTITAITALARLGGKYKFKTSLYTDGEVVGDTLHGNLYVKGGMDPRFDHSDMAAFVSAVKGDSVRVIDGNVYFDMTFKEQKLKGEGWCWDDDDKPITPLMYNGKDVFGREFFDALTREEIDVCDSICFATVPRSARLLCQRTATMDQVLRRMMKQSDNLYAESMFYQLGTLTGKASPRDRDCAALVSAFQRSIGLTTKNTNVADGSGLSLYNYTTPEHLVVMLRYAWQHPDIYNHLRPALPIAGVDGTLAKRMNNGAACSNINAKTGTVTGVSTLSGYALAPNKHMLCFAIMNQGIHKAAEGRNFQDLVCEAMTAEEVIPEPEEETSEENTEEELPAVEGTATE